VVYSGSFLYWVQHSVEVHISGFKHVFRALLYCLVSTLFVYSRLLFCDRNINLNVP
jgi:hypothetical protein